MQRSATTFSSEKGEHDIRVARFGIHRIDFAPAEDADWTLRDEETQVRPRTTCCERTDCFRTRRVDYEQKYRRHGSQVCTLALRSYVDAIRALDFQ